MSLFSTYDWWSTQCEEISKEIQEKIDIDQEEDVNFHAGSLHVTDLIQNGFHIIILGNNSGKLWAYKPTSSSSPQDLLFEYNFAKPILAFESGYLLLGSPDKQLAVLHPKQVTIYSLHESFGNAAHGQQFHLQPAYSINFQFVAYSIIIGAFGSRVKNPAAKEGKGKSGLEKNAQHAICVQGTDGSLHFFENDVNVLCVPSKNEHGGLPARKEKSQKHQFKDAETKKTGRKTHNIRAEVHGFPSELDYLPRNQTSVPNNAGTDDRKSIFPPETLTEEAENEEDFQHMNVEDTVRDEDSVQLTKAKFTFAPLEDTNLPTLLCYLSSEDSFVVFSGSWTIDCYRYATLLMQQITSRRKKLSLPEWSYVFGEPIFSLCCLQGNIFALGVRGTLVGLNPFGMQRFCKKLCLSPSALCPYATDKKLLLLVASAEGTLLVYDGGPNISGYADSHFGSLPSPSSSSTPKLLWSAKLPCTPVAMARANFEELSGLIVILTAEGHLQCCHMGTTPKNFTSSPSSRAHFMDHKEIEDKLMVQVSKLTTSLSVSTSNGTVELSLEFIVNNISLLPVFEEGLAVRNDDCYGEERDSTWKSSLEVDISLILIPMIPLNNVCLSATVESPLEATLEKNFIERLYEEIKVPMVVRANYDDSIHNDAIPSLVVEVVVSCFGGCSGTGEELSLMVFHTHTTLLPSAVFSQDIFHAGKENEGIDAAWEQSVDLKIFNFHFQDYKCPTIALLFPEFLFSQSDSNLTTFELYLFGHSGKKIQLVRRCKEESCEERTNDCVFSISSICMLPLYYFTYVLAQKLENHAAELGNQITGNAGKQKGAFFQVTPRNSEPLQELFEVIDAHTVQRKNVSELNNQLGFLINQLHMVECCILARVKDTTSNPIMSSEILLEQFLEKISSCINSLWLSQQELHFLSKKLRIIVHLVMQLQYEFTTSSSLKTFENAISFAVRDTINQGWEERSMANLDYALRGQRKSNLHNFDDGEMLSAEEELSILSPESIKKDIAHFVDKLKNTLKE